MIYGDSTELPQTIVHEGKFYTRNDIVTERMRMLELEIAELNKLLHTYRQAVFEVRDRLDKLDGDQQSWLQE